MSAIIDEWFRRPLIDRGALLRELMLGAPGPGATASEFEEHADRVLALLQPATGVLLTREEARVAQKALIGYGAEPCLLNFDDEDEMGALAARLEAAS